MKKVDEAIDKLLTTKGIKPSTIFATVCAKIIAKINRDVTYDDRKKSTEFRHMKTSLVKEFKNINVSPSGAFLTPEYLARCAASGARLHAYRINRTKGMFATRYACYNQEVRLRFSALTRVITVTLGDSQTPSSNASIEEKTILQKGGYISIDSTI